MLTSIENLTSHINVASNTIKSTADLSSVAKAYLICHPNSHSFADRTLVLDKPVKIGRSVGHNKTSANNGIFDCKVLSRNHALLWFEDGKFLLKDTRSSNGTFVNTERLSKSCEESQPREVFSGDTVQFGVDVVENSRNLTHGCVIATLRLFLPNGREAKPLPSIFTSGAGGDRSKVTLEDLYLLNQYLQESLQREKMLESKLSALQTLVKTLRDSTELSWKALISNNSLLSRVELLEVQLKCYSKKFAEDTLREELRALQEDKSAYEGVVKEYFQKILDEKLEAAQQYQDLTRALANMKTEFANTQLLLTNSQNELRELALKNTCQEKTIEELELKLHDAEHKAKHNEQKALDENTALYAQLDKLTVNEKVLQQTIQELETHGDYAHKQVMSLQSQVEQLQKHHSDVLCELVDPTVIKDKITDENLVRSWISIYTEALRKCKENTAALRNRVQDMRLQKAQKEEAIASLEAEVNKCIVELQNYRKEQLELEDQILDRKNELELTKPQPQHIWDELNEQHNNEKCNENDAIDLQEKKKLLNVIQRDVKMTDEHFKELEKVLKLSKDELTQLTVANAIEEDKLDLSEKQMCSLQNALATLQGHVRTCGSGGGDNSNSNDETCYQNDQVCIEDVQSLKKQLSEAHELAQEKQNVTVKLMSHFVQFTQLVNQRLNVVDRTVAQFSQIGEAAELADEINALKAQSDRLIEAVDDLHSLCERVQYYKDLVDENDASTPVSQQSKVLLMADNFASVTNSSSSPKSDDFIVLREKLCAISLEKKELESRLSQLQEQYDYFKSYPYFDIYIILVVVLICVGIFNFADKLSLVFGS